MTPGFAAALAAVLAAPAAPPPDPRIAPPPIAFAPWREIGPSEGFREFEASFPSPLPSGIKNNDEVPLRVFLPPGEGPFPAVLIAHYWGATDLRAERSLALELARNGVASAVLDLPYHLQRTPPGKRSGELAVVPDPEALRTTMAQATADCRRALDFLVTRPEIRANRLGVAGTSLGAIVSGLVYAVDDRVSRAAFVLGGADLARILWSSSRLVPQRDALRRKGFTEGRLRAELAPVETLTYLPRKAPGRAFVVQGAYDQVVPASSSNSLIRAIPDTSVLRIETGHYGGIFVQRRLLREVARFFAAEFRDEPFTPPRAVYAPTLRLGVIAGTNQGLEVGAGLDLFKFDRRGDGFATAFLSPRGPSLFLGRRIAPGLAIGGTASFRGAGVGLFWSSVL